MLEKLDPKEEQLTKFKTKHEEWSIKLKQSAKEIKTLNEKKWQTEQVFKGGKGQNPKIAEISCLLQRSSKQTSRI